MEQSEKTVGKLIQILIHQLGMLNDNATLFDVGQTIGMASGLFIQDKNDWRKEDLEWGQNMDWVGKMVQVIMS